MTGDIYELSRSPIARVQRRLKQWRHASPVRVSAPGPVVSFCFDDFPRSAMNGAAILEQAGLRGGFYASTRQMGQRSSHLGEMFTARDLQDLVARGHEIGAHTHTHLDCAQASVPVVEADVIANLNFLRAAGISAPPTSFAWPFGETSPELKLWAAERFHTSRGVIPGVNAGLVDRSQLRATLLTSDASVRSRAEALLRICLRNKGWLIFFTHDVQSAPGDYGVSLRHFSDMVQRVRDAGVTVLPPTEAAEYSRIPAPARDSIASFTLMRA